MFPLARVLSTLCPHMCNTLIQYHVHKTGPCLACHVFISCCRPVENSPTFATDTYQRWLARPLARHVAQRLCPADGGRRRDVSARDAVAGHLSRGIRGCRCTHNSHDTVILFIVLLVLSELCVFGSIKMSSLHTTSINHTTRLACSFHNTAPTTSMMVLCEVHSY